MKRFLIDQGGVLYLTSGELLRYDEKEAKDDEQKKKGVKEAKDAFKRIHDEPHTWYKAVEVRDSTFSPINTN